MKKEQKLNKNQKGFSLVELIIVIAIMAVLVGVLAPAFLRYVEKSRKSADVSAIDSIMSAMEACAIEPGLKMANGDKIIADFNDTAGKITFRVTVAAGTDVLGEMKAICGDDVVLRSSDWTADDFTAALTGTVGDNGTIKFTGDAGFAKIVAYAPALDYKMDK